MKSIYNFVIFVQWLSNLSKHVISKLPNGSSSDVADIRRPHPCKDPCFVSLIELKPPSGLRTSKNSVIMCHTMVSMSCSLDDLDVFLWNWLESGLSFSRVWVSLKWQADVSCRSNAWLPLTRNESLAFTYKRSGWSMDAGCGWDYESKSLDIKSYQVYVSERSQSCFLILYHLYPGWPVWPEEIPTDLCDMHTYLLVKVGVGCTRTFRKRLNTTDHRISETWYDMIMITKKQEHRSITKLWESCLPILAPPDCVRDAHVRWISTATTSNGLDKRGWLSKQMLADVGRVSEPGTRICKNATWFKKLIWC
jgi:hypothetical protein